MTEFFLRPSTLITINFEALKFTDPIFTALKNLNLFKNYTKNQEDSSNFSTGFALLRRPHLDMAYLVTVCMREPQLYVFQHSHLSIPALVRIEI